MTLTDEQLEAIRERAEERSRCGEPDADPKAHGYNSSPYCDCWLANPDETKALLAEVDALREALRKYGSHEAPCHTRYYEDGTCTCGFDAALSSPQEPEPKEKLSDA